MELTNTAVIQTKGLSKNYDGVSVLNDLNLNVPQHSIFGFLGPNGAGKTTTMKLLLGLIKPSSGQGTVFGHDIVHDSLAIRARIGYMPQQPHFYPTMTARETVRFTARFFFKGPPAKIEARVNEVLNLVGLADKADRPVKGFSGGERQRLGLAQAQVNYPDLLILDEPAAALDPIGRHDVLVVMEKLRKYATVFYSTHILDDVQQVSDTVAILNEGKLISQGPIEQLLNGEGKTIYTVALQGDLAAVRTRVEQEPWIEQITLQGQNGHTIWQVAVKDEAVAEAKLLRQLLADEQTTVTAFGRKKVELEEAFMTLVKGANDEQQ
ncbi:MAG: multidrug ABC transporter ATP-binding protein [Anaerolineaceae bacterium]|nr:multidrug ABC transporter ATP-binding protein [Anaerolineaceae bacterium]